MNDLAPRPQLVKPNGEADADTALRVLEMILKQELHFNQMCADFKKMASTWLLATFGGIGFLMSTELRIGVDLSLLIGGVAAAGATGVALLWVIDLMVYQRLLSSAFSWRGEIERQNQWLPPIFEEMRGRVFGKSVRFNIVWFYLLGTAVPAAISVVALAVAALPVLKGPGTVFTAIAALVGLAAVFRAMYRASIPAEAEG